MQPVFVSPYHPEKSNLARFTKQVADFVDQAAGKRISSVVAVQGSTPIAKAGRVCHVIDPADPAAYRLAAESINASPATIVSLQHDFQSFPGESGARVLELLNHCHKPLVTTLHSLPFQSTAPAKRIVQELAGRSQSLIVGAEFARHLLLDVYGVAEKSVQVISPGVSSAPCDRDQSHKDRVGLSALPVGCSFGLLQREMGLEVMIQALPVILASRPKFVYVIIGITSPKLHELEGEAYRKELLELATSLGVEKQIRFVNEDLEPNELQNYLLAADVFIAPNHHQDEVVSHSTAQAMAASGTVVSTSNAYAREVLGEGRGLLVPFNDSDALGEAVLRLLMDPQLATAIRLKAYQFAKAAYWPAIGLKYLTCFKKYCPSASSPSLPPTRSQPLLTS